MKLIANQVNHGGLILHFDLFSKLVIFSNSFLPREASLWEPINTRIRTLQKGAASPGFSLLFAPDAIKNLLLLLPSSSMGFHFRDCLYCRASLKLLEQLPTPFIPRLPFPFHQIILSLPAQIFIFHFILKPQRSKAVFFFFFFFWFHLYIYIYIYKTLKARVESNYGTC
jgi:hypothetical protein